MCIVSLNLIMILFVSELREAVAIRDYKGDGFDELSIKIGDLLEVVAIG